MSQSNYQVRRATIDDLVVLRRLWQQAQLPLAMLEKRLGEFQVVETPEGEVLGALGVQFGNAQGQIHSEVYRDVELASELRPRLWERVQTVARHHGLTRLWIKSAASIFWLDQGFEAAGSELLSERPGCFSDGPEEHWLTLKLRETSAATISMRQELELFRLAQKQERERLLRQTQVLRVLAGIIVGTLLIVVACGIWYVLRQGRP